MSEACPAGVQLASDVDLRSAALSGRRVVVVGGGMTAATLTLSALKSGADHVTLITRRPLQTRSGFFNSKPFVLLSPRRTSPSP
jgi:cation diffusion facilitator CzcD-associated flavoprotein CzcO